jgi:hypothetical protein
MSVLASAVDWDALGEVVVYSLAAGLGVTFVFSLAIFGATRAVDVRRDGHVAAAGVYGIVMVIGLAAIVALIALGIAAMTSK